MRQVVPHVPEMLRRPRWMTPLSLRPDAAALGAANENHPERVNAQRDPLGAVVCAERAGAEIVPRKRLIP